MPLDELQADGFQIEFHSHAKAILTVDFPQALDELEQALRGLSVPVEEVIGSGGGETRGTQRLRRALAAAHWRKGRFEIKKMINGRERESQSHEIDHVREIDGNLIALEIEWNNKDPFFDRDLENFKRLHAEGAISVGVIITRGVSMQEQMRSFVHRFAIARGITSVDDLATLGLSPTARQSMPSIIDRAACEHCRYWRGDLITRDRRPAPI
jgi:Restriction endonuclease BglII